jgi:hypothetical protein
LRYIFALFGSQGVSHFVAEVSAFNDAALSLFAAGGFCRSSRITYYEMDEAGRSEPLAALGEDFRLATPSAKNLLFQLHQDALPPDLRLVLQQVPDDFKVQDLIPYTSVERNKQRLMRKRVWYWVNLDPERHSLRAAVKVTAQAEFGYRLDFAVHPGWKGMSGAVVDYAINSLVADAPKAPICARVYDFQPEIAEALKQRKFERTGDFFLVAREHWQRARKPKRKADATVGLSPAINFPLATERKIVQ